MSQPMPKKAPETRRVMLPAETRVQAVGPYRPGVPVAVPAGEAVRLIQTKGFVALDDADQQPRQEA